ncbi:MAG: hypothetical protein AABY26_01305 [Nanoarchaeota archaeon]
MMSEYDCIKTDIRAMLRPREELSEKASKIIKYFYDLLEKNNPALILK